MLIAAPDYGRKSVLLTEERYNSTNFQTLWNFEGVFKYSPLFYGWYTYKESKKSGYRMPFAYFITGLVVYAYSFFATLRKMAENSRMSKLSEKDDECIFSWKLFTAWDYMIGNAETAHNRIASIVVGFKEALLEEAEKKKEARNWKITAYRLLVNTLVLSLLVFSAYAVVIVVKRSTEPEAKVGVWRSNEITFVMTIISIVFPMIFEGLGFLEKYHPRKQLRLQLARIMVLNLLNLYSLIFALFAKINDMTSELETFKNNSDLESLSQCIFSCNTSIISISNTTSGVGSSLKSLDLISVLPVAYPLIQKILKETTATEYQTETTNSEPITDFPVNYSSPSGFSDNGTTDVSIFSENFTPSYNYSLATANGSFIDDENEFFDSFRDVLLNVLRNFSVDVREQGTSSSEREDSITSLKYTESITPDFQMTEAETEQFSKIIPTTPTPSKALEKTDVKKTRCIKRCKDLSNSTKTCDDNYVKDTLPYKEKRRLRNLCWETMFGQELIKLTVMDLVMTIVSTLAMDFVRGVFVRVMNPCWCWDLEKKFPQYGDFKVAENILHLVNNQGMVWMGMFFSPGLVVLNIVKLLVLMYFRTWIVLTCNIPHEVIFRASRSNNFYYALLLMMLFLCVLPVGYAIVRIPPSCNCGPFSNYPRIFNLLTYTIKKKVPPYIENVLDYIASPAIVIPLLLLLVLIIYYLISLTSALREANADLKIQLRRERTEERRKMFQIADRRRRGAPGGSGEFSNTPFGKWKKLLSTMPSSGKSFDDTSPRQESCECPQIKEEKDEPPKAKDFFTKFIKKALGKTSTSDEDNQETPAQDEGTDTEQHESLPEDLVSVKDSTKSQQPPKSPLPSRSFDYQKSLLQKRNSQKSISETSDKHKMRQDSGSSVWSDNIPVITISKTESAECLDVVPEMSKVGQVTETPQTKPKFKPTIKCALTKQSTEIDEDVICYFSKDPEQQPGIFRFEEKDVAGVSESSEDTARESSTDTVLVVKTDEADEAKENNDTQGKKVESGVGGANEVSSGNGSATESSAEYNDITSL